MKKDYGWILPLIIFIVLFTLSLLANLQWWYWVAFVLFWGIYWFEAIKEMIKSKNNAR